MDQSISFARNKSHGTDGAGKHRNGIRRHAGIQPGVRADDDGQGGHNLSAHLAGKITRRKRPNGVKDVLRAAGAAGAAGGARCSALFGLFWQGIGKSKKTQVGACVFLCGLN